MPDPRPDVLDFLLTRRSRPAKTLAPPAPDDAALAPILTAGLRVPDHGKLEPWTLHVLRSEALAGLAEHAERAGAAAGRPSDEVAKAAASFRAAPMMIAVLSEPVTDHKIPVREQFLSAGAVCLSLVNAALAAGWGASWITGWTADDADFLKAAFGASPPAGVAGYVVLGSETAAPPERPRPDLSARVRGWQG